MADTCERLASKTVGANRCQILKSLEFGRGETFAENGKIISLKGALESSQITEQETTEIH